MACRTRAKQKKKRREKEIERNVFYKNSGVNVENGEINVWEGWKEPGEFQCLGAFACIMRDKGK